MVRSIPSQFSDKTTESPRVLLQWPSTQSTWPHSWHTASSPHTPVSASVQFPFSLAAKMNFLNVSQSIIFLKTCQWVIIHSSIKSHFSQNSIRFFRILSLSISRLIFPLSPFASSLTCWPPLLFVCVSLDQWLKFSVPQFPSHLLKWGSIINLRTLRGSLLG